MSQMRTGAVNGAMGGFDQNMEFSVTQWCAARRLFRTAAANELDFTDKWGMKATVGDNLKELQSLQEDQHVAAQQLLFTTASLLKGGNFVSLSSQHLPRIPIGTSISHVRLLLRQLRRNREELNMQQRALEAAIEHSELEIKKLFEFIETHEQQNGSF